MTLIRRVLDWLVVLAPSLIAVAIVLTAYVWAVAPIELVWRPPVDRRGTGRHHPPILVLLLG